MTSSSAQPAADSMPIQDLHRSPRVARASAGSTLLPLLALGILVLMLMARAAFDYAEPVTAAEAEPTREIETSSAL